MECASIKELEEYLAKMKLIIQFSFLQVDMDDYDSPFKQNYWVETLTNGLKDQTYEVKIQVNEFVDINDYFGVFVPEPEPDVFFSIDSIIPKVETAPFNLHGWNATASQEIISELEAKNSSGTVPLPKHSYRIQLSPNQLKMERKFYSFFTLLGDIGGFNGAIIIFPAFIMQYYSEHAYQMANSEQVPVRKSRKKKD